MNGSTAVFGIYKTREEVERAVDALKANDFSASDVSVLLPDAAPGAALSAAFGWLVGVSNLTIPGVGSFITTGPIIESLAGLGVGGPAGGIGGALIGLGLPEYEAKRFEGHVKDGGILLSVQVDSDELATKAKSALELTGAEDIAASQRVETESMRTIQLPPAECH